MRYAFIEANRGVYCLRRLCQALGVSRSGYYGWRQRAPSRRAQADHALLPLIEAVHHQHRQAYGALKVWRALNLMGTRCGKHRVARLRRQNGIETLRKRRFRRAYAARNGVPPAPNLLTKPFFAATRDTVWVGDITFIPTRQGWLYLAVVVDLHTREVVGWSMRDRSTRDLPLEALRMAIKERRPAPGLIHHTDQGIQYSSGEYRQLLREHDLLQSMSRRGNCYDNACAESFFSTLKNELTHHRDFATRAQARAAIFEFIEVFYNRKRLHQSLDYQVPAAFAAVTTVP